MNQHQDVRQEIRDAVDDLHPRQLGTFQMKLINKHLGWSIKRKEWEDRRELLESGTFLDRLRYFRETWRWPDEGELEYVESRIETAAENEARFDAARDELGQYEACEKIRRKSD